MIGDSIIVDGGISLENYKDILFDLRQLILLKNSLLISFGTTFFSLLIGVPIGYLLTKTDLFGRRYFSLLYLIPLLIPSYINSISWIHILGRNQPLNLFLMDLFSTDKPIISPYGIIVVIFIFTLSYFPFVTLLTISGLLSMDDHLEEAGRLIYPEFKVFQRITFPIVWPNILSGALFVFIFSIINYGVPDMLRVKTYPVEIFIQFSALYNDKKAVATAMPLIIFTTILIGIQWYYMKNRSYITLSTHHIKRHIIRLGKWQVPGVGFISGILFLSVFLPVMDLLITCEDINAFSRAWNSAKDQILYTIILSVVSATVITILSFFISFYLEMSHTKWKGLLDILTLLPFAMPGTVLAIGLIKIWNHPLTNFIYGTSIIIVFGYIARFIPFVIRIIMSNIKHLDTELVEAALLFKNNRLKILTRILLPLTRNGLIIGWIIAFILCVGELGTTLLVIPPGKASLTIRIYTLMHYGANKLVAALCIILIGMIILPSIGLGLLVRARPK